jgi:ferredoxin
LNNGIINLKIDGKPVSVPTGSTILDAARQLGIEIPTLCFLAGVKEDRPSCLACVVRINKQPRLMPSCSTQAGEGMEVESESAPVREARKAALEFLFSDHLGDCISVCQRVCPAHLQIPDTIRLVAAGKMAEAVALVKENVVFPGVLGRICRAPCETGCRRSKLDGAVAIQLIEREVADQDRAGTNRYVPTCAPATGKKVAIVGAGATGLSAAFYLLRLGHQPVVFDDHPEPGGNMRYGVEEKDLPREVLDGDIETIRRIGLEFRGNTRLGRDLTLEQLRADYDAVILAVGNMQKTKPAELGVTATERAVRISPHTLQTNVPGVYAAGSCIRTGYEPARSVGEGKMLAECVDGFLKGQPVTITIKEFTSSFPKFTEPEAREFLQGANALLSIRELVGLAEEAAGRCCHCDCRGFEACKLRIYSEAYNVDVKRNAGGRRREFQFIRQPGGIIFEPGKCISCGICVELTDRAREPLGLTFIGRGFDVQIGVPLEGALTDALHEVGEQCVRHCPTGALTFEQDERNVIKGTDGPTEPAVATTGKDHAS